MISLQKIQGTWKQVKQQHKDEIRPTQNVRMSTREQMAQYFLKSKCNVQSLAPDQNKPTNERHF